MNHFRSFAVASLFTLLSIQAVGQNWSPFPCTSTTFPVAHLLTSGNTLFIGRHSPAQVVTYDQASGCQFLNALPDPQMTIRAMAIYNGDLYVSGYSWDTTRIYKQNGGGWTVVGTCFQSIIDAMIVHNNELFVGGLIYEIDGTSYNNIAKWNGSSWSDPGGGIPGSTTDAHVRSFAVYNGELYAGGDSFAPLANDIAKWNGVSWVPVGTGITGAPTATVFAMKEYNGNLYVAGNFDVAGGVAVNNIARWNGTNWSNPGGGIGGGDSLVVDLEVFNNELYAGGSFTDPGSNVVKFNGSTWSTLAGGGVYFGGVTSLAAFGNSLIVGGGFSWILSGGVLIEYITRYSSCSGTISASGPTNVCSGTNVQLNAPASLSYQWRIGTQNISGANSQTYAASQTGSYSCMLTTTCGVIPSNAINVTIRPTPVATITAAGPLTFCVGDSVKLNANTGSGLTYQWIKYGNMIAGATAATYTAKTTGSYKVQVTNNSLCSKKSSATVVAVNPKPSASITASGSTSICAGDSVMLNATTNIPGSTFQWKKYANIIPGATTASYAAKTTGKYKAIVTSPAGCVRASNAIIVTVVCREMSGSEEVTDMQIFPNPASDELNVVLPQAAAAVLSITDVTGSVKWTHETEPEALRTAINISSLPPGIYFLQIHTEKGTTALKFIKQEN